MSILHSKTQLLPISSNRCSVIGKWMRVEDRCLVHIWKGVVSSKNAIALVLKLKSLRNSSNSLKAEVNWNLNYNRVLTSANKPPPFSPLNSTIWFPLLSHLPEPAYRKQNLKKAFSILNWILKDKIHWFWMTITAPWWYKIPILHLQILIGKSLTKTTTKVFLSTLNI